MQGMPAQNTDWILSADDDWLHDFLRESLEIEGINRRATAKELYATAHFINAAEVTVHSLVNLVAVYQPDARLRDQPGLDVRVGDHVAPAGGHNIRAALQEILTNFGANNPWRNHVLYETLHPFTDGNGRSGRALWAFDMLHRGMLNRRLNFLHHFYYQTLSSSRFASEKTKDIPS